MAASSSLSLLLPLLLTVLATLFLAQPALTITSDDLTNGQFDTKDGSICSWYELRKSPHNVTFGMACRCHTEAGHGQGYTCHYFGDPDDCEVYRESGQSFYDDIAKHIVETANSGCDLKSLSHERCPDNVLTRKEYTPAEHPCDPKRKERYEL